ncbi:MAG TPA: glycosyltransferase [Terracidiphilus sp.]|nr:glycosyltransferase [Terracidiphilus sp.]
MSSPQNRVAVLTNSISRLNGGIFEAVRNLTLAINTEKRYTLSVFSAIDAYTTADAPLWGATKVHAFPVRGPRSFGYSPELTHALKASNADLLHVHGIWMHPSVAARSWSRQTTKPYIVSPHGLLKPAALQNSGWKKRLAALLYENAHLRHATCLHALNSAEAEAFREYGLRNPICVIPNGTILRDEILRDRQTDGRSILYLGRIHPLKGLRNLITAWSAVRNEAAAMGWRLTIAGWDQNHYRAELERLADQLGVRSSVEFLGPQYGEEKELRLRSASAFILPSESEGLPIGVLEAWSYGLPVLMTQACNLPDGVLAGAALLMDSEAQSIAAVLLTFFALTDDERAAMGRNGRSLVCECYQWEHIGKSMTEVYDWILGQKPKPSCVLV